MLIRRFELDDDKRKKKKKKRRYGEAADFTYAVDLPPDQHPHAVTTGKYFETLNYGSHGA